MSLFTFKMKSDLDKMGRQLIPLPLPIRKFAKRKYIMIQILLAIVLVVLTTVSLHFYNAGKPLQNEDCSELLKVILDKKFFTIQGNSGRIGNQLWTFASAFSFAKSLNRTYYISKNLKEHNLIEKRRRETEKIFPRLKELYLHIKPPKAMEISVNHGFAKGKMQCCSYQNILDHSKNKSIFLIIKNAFTQHIKNIEKDMNEFRKYLEFNSDIKKKGNTFVSKHNLTTTDFICVHIRRTDFVRIKRTVSEDVIVALIEYVLGIQNKRKILFFGDDIKFLAKIGNILKNKNRTDSDIISNNESGVDLYLAGTVCSSYLITHQSTTFGFWSAFLTRNWKNVYYYYVPHQEPTLYRKDFPLPWNAIGYSSQKVDPIELVD